jgi:hypothetical protein
MLSCDIAYAVSRDQRARNGPREAVRCSRASLEVNLIANALSPIRPHALQGLARPVIGHGVLGGQHEQASAPQLDPESQGSHLSNRLLRPAAKLRADLVLPLLRVHVENLAFAAISCEFAGSEGEGHGAGALNRCDRAPSPMARAARNSN